MALRYAVIDEVSGKVRRVSNRKVTKTAVPVVYPEPFDLDRRVYTVIQNPIGEWDVFSDHVEPTYTITQADFKEVKERKRTEARRMRYEREVAGIELEDGLFVATDSVSQSRLTGLMTAVESGSISHPVPFEMRPGEWVTLSPARVKEVFRAAAEHVQACFGTCRRIHALLDAAQDVFVLADIDVGKEWDKQVININTAEAEKLQELSGVGASMAQAIIDAGRGVQ